MRDPASGRSPAPALPRWGAAGVFHAWCALLVLPSDRVVGLVPRGLVPEHQELTPPGTHPVLLMLGRHSGVRAIPWGFRGASYGESAVIVPWLRGDGADAVPTCAHLPRLYLDSWLFVILGWLYALPKWRARIAEPESGYAVRRWVSGETLLSAEFVADGPVGRPEEFPHFAPVAPLYAQPLRQRFPPGPWICSRMVFELDRARLRSAAARVEIRSGFLGGLPAGVYGSDGIDRTSLGAYRLEVPWRLSLPAPCAWRRRGEGGLVRPRREERR